MTEPAVLDRLRGARWIFFDVGSTILDEAVAAEDEFAQVSRMLAARGIERSAEQIRGAFTRACVDRASRQFIGMLERLGVSDEREQRAIMNGLRYRHDLERPYPGAVDAIRRLAKRYRLGVIANQYLGTAERLDKHGMTGCFRTCCSSAELRLSKPDMAIFRHALADAGCAAHEAVMVGDRCDNDIRPARSLGMMTVRVRTGPTASLDPLDEHETPDLTVSGVADLANLVLDRENLSS